MKKKEMQNCKVRKFLFEANKKGSEYFWFFFNYGVASWQSCNENNILAFYGAYSLNRFIISILYMCISLLFRSSRNGREFCHTQ